MQVGRHRGQLLEPGAEIRRQLLALREVMRPPRRGLQPLILQRSIAVNDNDFFECDTLM
jgi:hypothetical protein